MNNGWEIVKIEDILLVPSRNGLTKPSAIRGKGVKMIAMGELFAHPIINDIEMDRVPVTDKELQSSNVEVNDLLFARQSLTLEGAGKCSIVKEVNDPTVFESHLIRLRINSNIADPWYVYYYFNSYYGKHSIQNIVNQVAAAGIKGSDLVKLEIPLPSLDEQKRISSILFSYDEKISTNRKICVNLEAQAQALFKHWFIDFAPFKDGKFVESELGMIPEGWRVGTLGEIAEVSSGKRPLERFDTETEEHNVPLIGASCVMGYTNEAFMSTKILLTGRVGTLGVIQRFNNACWPSDNTLVLTTQFYEFVYQTLKTLNYSGMNRGTSQPLITQGDLKKTSIIIPPDEVINEFEDTSSKLMSILEQNNKESKILSSLRDTLLPKLMSGEIKV